MYLYAGNRFRKNGYTRLLFMEAWLQKSAQPCSQGKQAGFQEDERICQHSWNKWMTLKSIVLHIIESMLVECIGSITK